VHDAAARGVVAIARFFEFQPRDFVQQRAFLGCGQVVGLVDKSRRAGMGIEKLGLRWRETLLLNL